jgi:NAD(P)-dependent dehydrogenase (short-subunit alcohol dehydrogenase family)
MVGDLLAGKVAIVTGGGRGVGREHALALAAEGARVVVNDLGGGRQGGGSSQEVADKVVEEIRAKGGEAVASYESVADFKASQQIIQRALDAFGRLDILVNNAGVFRSGFIEDLDEDDFDTVIDVHVKGTFNLCRHAVPIFKEQRSGRILNTASNQWRAPDGGVVYSAAKGAIVSITWDLAWELYPFGVTVNAISPFANTSEGREQDTSERAKKVAAAHAGNEKRAKYVELKVEPKYVPPMLVYLSSDLASNVTGLVFRAGGGKIAVFSHPMELRGIYRDYEKEGPWPIEDLVRLLPSTVLGGDTIAPHI